MRMLVSTLAIAVASSVSVPAQTSQQDSPESLRKYVPVLPSVKAQYWQINPTSVTRSGASAAAFTSSQTTDGNPHSW